MSETKRCLERILPSPSLSPTPSSGRWLSWVTQTWVIIQKGKRGKHINQFQNIAPWKIIQVMCPCGTLLSNKKELTIDAQNNLDDSLENYAKGEESQTQKVV